ncbi:MAG TPA: potassium/proton antiporter [Dongiaceae bacterium]|nr:potassium/proton antiporter [Dongiaceae bacterium]
MESINFINTLLLLGAVLAMVGIFSSLIAERFGAPLLLVFLVVGMLAGEDGPGGLHFNDYELTYLIGSLALAIILFDGGSRTRLAAFRGTLVPSTVLATIGVVLTAAIVGVLAAYVLDLSYAEGLLIGAMVGSTDAAAVFFLLHSGGLELKRRVGTVLEIESATNDPIAVLMTIVLVQMLLAGAAASGWQIAGDIALQALIGTGMGLAGGFAISWLLNKAPLPGGLHPVFVLTGAVLTYAAASLLQGSGLLAVFLAGLVVGNRPMRAYANIVNFQEAATWLSQIVMFTVLGLLVTPSRLIVYALPALAIAAWLMLVARPAAIWLCLLPFRFRWQETTFISWVGLRGAVSIFLAAIPTLSNVPHADVYFNIAFVVVLVSLLVQGWSIAPAARWLGLALPRSRPAVRRVELDLPGQLEYELVGYPIDEDSAVLRPGALPPWARLALVVRDNAILMPADARPLRPADHAYFLAPPHRARRLDSLFAARSAEEAEHEVAGEFTFNGATQLEVVARLYGLAIPPEQAKATVAELFAERFDGKPDLGDHVEVGGVRLVARDIVDDRVTKAGLQIDDDAGSLVTTLLARPTRLARFLQTLRARRRGKR